MLHVKKVLEIGYWGVVWFGIVQLTKTMVTPPASLQKIENKKEQKKKTLEYINNFISLFHAIFLISICGYAMLLSPWQLNRPLTSIEEMIVCVEPCKSVLIWVLYLRYNIRYDERFE